MEKKIAIAAASVAAIFVAGTIVVAGLNKANSDLVDCGVSAVAGGNIGGPFELINSRGETVTDADVITAPSLIYFGYTFCPDVCPLDTARNAQAVSILEEQGIEVTPVFISIDPKRDTPEVVGEFAFNFHDRMIGLTGTEDQVKAASVAYRTYYQAHDDGTDFYLVDHSVQSYFNIPGLGVVDFFGRAESPELVAERMACVIEKTS